MNTISVSVRRVNEWDGPSMLKIYRPFVETGLALTERTVPTLADYIARIDRYTYGKGWLICEIDRKPAGFCHLLENPLDLNDPFTAEVVIYVKSEFQRKGVGRALIHLLILMNQYQNRKKLIARFSSDNAAASAFFAAVGFVPLSTAIGLCEHAPNTSWMEFVLTPQSPNADQVTKPYLIEAADYEQARENAALLIKQETP